MPDFVKARIVGNSVVCTVPANPGTMYEVSKTNNGYITLKPVVAKKHFEDASNCRRLSEYE